MRPTTYDIIHSVEGDTWLLVTKDGKMERHELNILQLAYLLRTGAEAMDRAIRGSK